jgi:myo-inositol-1(or 4)-monophosphatase
MQFCLGRRCPGRAIVRASYGADLTRYGKQGHDFATEADIQAEQAILAVISVARPDGVLVGEESGTGGGADASRRWLVDPLCGTLNFSR